MNLLSFHFCSFQHNLAMIKLSVGYHLISFLSYAFIIIVLGAQASLVHGRLVAYIFDSYSLLQINLVTATFFS